jgi:hypothetical protein
MNRTIEIFRLSIRPAGIGGKVVIVFGLFYALNILSCSGSGAKDDTTPTFNAESYFVSRTAVISAEYGLSSSPYKFKVLETRKIFICGTIPSNATLDDYGKVWWTLGSDKRNAYIGNSANSYWNYQTGQYTVPLTFDPTSLSSGSANITINIGTANEVANSSTTFNVDVVNLRDYNVEYNSQTGYDLLSRGFAWGTVTSVYAGAGTTIKQSTYTSNLVAQDVIEVVDDVAGRDELFDYAYQYCSNALMHNPNLGLLYAVKNIKVTDKNGVELPNNPDALAVGIARSGPAGYSYVKVGKLDGTLNSTTLPKEFTRVVIHELGHQRGIQSHSTGHNGIWKSLCIMMDPVEQNLTQSQMLTLWDRPYFCEGHNQVLLDKVW